MALLLNTGTHFSHIGCKSQMISSSRRMMTSANQGFLLEEQRRAWREHGPRWFLPGGAFPKAVCKKLSEGAFNIQSIGAIKSVWGDRR